MWVEQHSLERERLTRLAVRLEEALEMLLGHRSAPRETTPFQGSEHATRSGARSQVMGSWRLASTFVLV